MQDTASHTWLIQVNIIYIEKKEENSLRCKSNCQNVEAWFSVLEYHEELIFFYFKEDDLNFRMVSYF